jgi:hypothetical protein
MIRATTAAKRLSEGRAAPTWAPLCDPDPVSRFDPAAAPFSMMMHSMSKRAWEHRWFLAGLATSTVAALALSCSPSFEAISRDGGGAGGAGGVVAGGTGGLAVDGGITKIPLGSTQCSDGIDNDGDGLIDYEDPECVGPLDNDESSFATGIPGDNVDPCKQDCFFDGNSGMGDDGCEWQLKCDPLSKEPKCPYDATYAAQHTTECSVAASQSAACVSFCQRLVPNGCDCFGCCLIPGAPSPIRLAATCTAADFGDPAKCPPCTQVTQCANPCDHCEICIGKPTLPADCGPVDAGTPPLPSCGAYTACGPGTGVDPSQCPTNTGCVTGCCLPIVP